LKYLHQQKRKQDY